MQFRKLNLLLACLVAMISWTANTHAQPVTSMEGTWQGKLTIPGGMKLRIVFHISQNDEGNYSAKMDSPDQGATGLPVGAVTFVENKLTIEVPAVRGNFEGTWTEESGKIDGKWNQSGMAMPLILERVDKVEAPKRPQAPQKPYPYIEEEVNYENEAAGISLAGTLTMPKTGAPFPAVVLITGSGPQDRNESLLGHKPFLVLADHLTRNGIAVLRFDDRGVGQSTGDFATATSEDFAGDVKAGIKYLLSRDEIDAKKIGLVGHSEGGLIAPMVATESPDVAFVVLMAGPGLSGEKILLLQSNLIAKANGAPEILIEQGLIDAAAYYKILKAEPDNAAAEKKLRAYRQAAWDKSSEEMKAEARKMGDPEKLFEAGLKQMLTPWFRYFISYDPAPTLQKVKVPVLAINGEKDLQVPPKENLAAIAEALTDGGNANFKTVEMPGLNHLLQKCETGAPGEYSQIEETISPTALQAISNWILSAAK